MKFHLSTAHDEARSRQAQVTTDQRRERAQAHIDEMIAQYKAGEYQWTTGTQYVKLKSIADFCQDNGLDVPLWVKAFVLLHEEAQRGLER